MTALYIILAAVVYIGLCFVGYACLAFFGLTDDLEEQRRDVEGLDFTYTGHFCFDCRHHLGGGQCRLNAESECAEGGGFELWEAKPD